MINFYPNELRGNKQEASLSPIRRPEELPTDFVDVALATADSFLYEDLSISEPLNDKKEVERQIQAMEASVANDDDESRLADLKRARQLGGDGFARKWLADNEEYLKSLQRQHPDAGIMTDKEISQRIIDIGKEKRDRRNNIASRATGMGRIGGTFLGAAAGSLADPVVLGTMFLGAGASASVVRTMAIEAGIGAGTEMVIQPQVYNYKKKIDSPFTVAEAFTNIMAGGVGAAAISGGLKATIVGTRKLIAKGELRLTAEREAAMNVLEDLAEAGESSLDANLGKHIRNTDRAIESIKSGRVADVGEEVPSGFLRDDVEAVIEEGSKNLAKIGRKALKGGLKAKEMQKLGFGISRLVTNKSAPSGFFVKDLDMAVELGNKSIRRIANKAKVERLSPKATDVLHAEVKRLQENKETPNGFFENDLRYLMRNGDNQIRNLADKAFKRKVNIEEETILREALNEGRGVRTTPNGFRVSDLEDLVEAGGNVGKLAKKGLKKILSALEAAKVTQAIRRRGRSSLKSAPVEKHRRKMNPSEQGFDNELNSDIDTTVKSADEQIEETTGKIILKIEGEDGNLVDADAKKLLDEADKELGQMADLENCLR